MSSLHRFRPRLLDALQGYTRARLGADIGAGITVGVVALPLAMAFAIASGVPPEAGLVTAIVAGLLISLLGGSNVQIGGPAGAFIVIVYGIIERYGLPNLLIATMLSGVLLCAMGWLRLGVLVRYVPVSIVIGFTNGIAVLIALSQAKDLLGLQVDKMPADFFAQIGVLATQGHTVNALALGVGLACLAVVVLWPKSYAMPTQPQGLWPHLRRGAAHLPGTVVALGLATAATALLSLPLETIGSRFGGIPQSLPMPAWPDITWASAKQLVIPTLTIALLGAIESLLCARVADNMAASVAGDAGADAPNPAAPIPRHDPNQELIGQGVANLVVPLFGGIPATGTIARTVTNVRAGATSPVAGIVHALTLLLIVLVAAPLAAHVPLAALAGILLFVAWNMGEWRELTRLRRFTLPYRVVLLGTFLMTVVFDLMVAMEVGLVLACIFFIWRMGTLFSVEPQAMADAPAGVWVVRLYGALFFGAVGKVESVADNTPSDTRVVLMDLHRLVSMDTSGLDALVHCERALRRRGVRLMLAEANPQPLSLMQRTGFLALLGEESLADTVAQALARLRASTADAPAPVN